ncbi:MAG: glucokinase [Gammaproteobacteria bacterium]|nr:glucokinase [Gammaproteobacteria bacterium]
MTQLLADIGGTNTRCALSAAGAPMQIRKFRNVEFDGPAELLSAYLDGLAEESRPVRGLFAVAAPIRSDEIRMINIDWQFSRSDLQSQLQLDGLQLLNDFEALAHALPALSPADLVQVGGGTAAAGKPKAVLGPGTGLGVASLLPVAGGWQAIAGEGGHVSLPACDDREADIIQQVRRRFGHCSAERLISGPGLSLIHACLHGEPEIEPVALGALIDADDPAALDSLELMCRLLGTVTANLALTIGAFGGVYIGGGILPRYPEFFLNSGFRARFEDKGRYSDYLRAIPTWLITAGDPTLIGLNERARG